MRLLHLAYLSMNLRWNSERIVSLMKCFSYTERNTFKKLNSQASYIV